jgi:hypothetical protein
MVCGGRHRVIIEEHSIPRRTSLCSMMVSRIFWRSSGVVQAGSLSSPNALSNWTSHSSFVSKVGGWTGRESTMWCVGPLFGQGVSNGDGGGDDISDGSGSEMGIESRVKP